MGHKGGKSRNVSKTREYSTIETKSGHCNNNKVLFVKMFLRNYIFLRCASYILAYCADFRGLIFPGDFEK